MQYEHRYMLELSRFRAPDGEKLAALMDRSLHYPYILGQLLMHRMGAAAYVSLGAVRASWQGEPGIPQRAAVPI